MPSEVPTGGQREEKQVSNPFSTGGGGPWFEVQAISAFAALMLAGKFAPCLPCMPIREIRLQARQAGYRIDDFVVHVADGSQTDKRKLLTQVKHGISFTKSDNQFRETIAAAWKDYNNAANFSRKKDAIAIIAGPLSATDTEDTRKILEWSRACASPHEFFEKVNATNFSSDAKREKLAAFRAHIDAAAGAPVNDEEVFEFLLQVHVLGLDLDVYSGFMHALLHGIIGHHNTDDPTGVWSRILQHVASFNPAAGTLTAESFPEDVRAAFSPRPVEVMPRSIAKTIPPKTTLDWNNSEFAEALAVANLLGGWSEGSEADIAIIAKLTPDQPKEWLRKMKEVLQHPESPLSHANGIWTIKQRASLWSNLASRVFGDTLMRFKESVREVLAERDPRFDLEPEKRFAAQIYRKVLAHSWPLRNGIAETLALLGTKAAQLPNCAPSAGEAAATAVVQETFDEADWILWASLDRLLPTLAEGAPNAFLNAVEQALRQQPCPYDAIFAQERPFFGGGTYMTGLLWALETLAWDETYLVRVSVTLAMLAARDPGGTWGNRPANSLTTIFLPWFPQTRASIEKRRVAVQAVVSERREVGWRLLMSLLPQHHGASSGTHKPKWRNKVDTGGSPEAKVETERPTIQEYWEQVDTYAKMAIKFVKLESAKLKELIDSLDSLPEPALNEVLEFARSEAVSGLPDERRLPIWTALSSFVRKHRAFSEAKWALPKEIVDKIDQAASKLAPRDPTVKHRVLFVTNTWVLHEDHKDWQKNEERLASLRANAIQEILSRGGIPSVIAFAEQVENPSQVGFALGQLESLNVENDLLPKLVLSPEPKYQQLVQGYVWARWQREQWTWFDRLNTDTWSKNEIVQVLTYLPFDMNTWKRAEQRLGDDAKEYWTRVPVHSYQKGDPDYAAVDALLKHGRPRAAVACLATRVHDKLPIDPSRAIDALLGAVNSTEPAGSIDTYAMEIVIKALQDDDKADRNRLMAVEWAYLGLFEHSHVTGPKSLNAAIATDSQLFCEIIRKIFKSDRETEGKERPEPTEEDRAIGQNAYRLLRCWRTVPGTDASGGISAELLNSWIDAVKASLEESGHLTVGLHMAGEVFIHAPPDPDGLFMSHAVAVVLNREDMAELRRGYANAIYNSRGVHFVDPTGAPEKELSAAYRQKADAAENAGYHRLAVTLRFIADGYMREAEQVIATHATEENENLS